MVESIIKTQEFKEEHHDNSRNVSSGPIQDEVLTITSEYPSSGDRFESKFQDKISLSNQIFEQPEEEFIDIKGEQQMEPRKFSSEHTEDKIITLPYETLFSEDCFENRLQDKFDKSDNIFEQPEEELMDFIE